MSSKIFLVQFQALQQYLISLLKFELQFILSVLHFDFTSTNDLIKPFISIILGVADGVGGWREYGIDPSQFSKKLMKACETLVAKDTVFPCGPKELLASAYKELLEDKVLIQGKIV